LNAKLDELAKLAQSASSAAELQIVRGDDAAMKFTALAALLDNPDQRHGWYAKYAAIFDGRAAELQATHRAEQEAEAKLLNEKLQESEYALREIQDAAGQVQQPADLLILQRTSPLLKKLDAMIAALPDGSKKKFSERLDAVFRDRQRALSG